MTKKRQNLVLFITPSIDPWSSPSKIGTSYVNRFVIDEEAGFELLGIYTLSTLTDVSPNEEFIVRQKNIEDRFFDHALIDSAIKKAAEFKAKRLNTQLIFAGDLFPDYEVEIAYCMKIHKIRSIMVTKLEIERQHLITKELMEMISKGEYYNVRIGGAHFTNKSVFDDLESFYKNVKFQNNRKACTNRFGHAYSVHSFFLPKLTNKELKLMEMKDKDYLKTFQNTYRTTVLNTDVGNPDVWNDDDPNYDNPDVDRREMKLSESKSKFVLTECHRWTFIINMTGQVPSIYPTRKNCWTVRWGRDWEIWLPH